MIYLSGVIRPDLGVIVTPMMGNALDLTRTPWGADTGCFAKPEAHCDARYLAWLRARTYAASTCLFATAPDVVGDAAATWERSRDVLPMIRALGFPAALVAQDGIERMVIEWGSFDVLFIGGTTKWKLSHYARELIAEAKRRGKHVHMGRVNSEVRLRTAAMKGCDSADGTFLAFGPDINTPRLEGWLDSLKRAPMFTFSRSLPCSA